jgi:hypothetical protein
VKEANGYAEALLQITYQANLSQGDSKDEFESCPIEPVKDCSQFDVVLVSSLKRMEESSYCLAFLFGLDFVKKVIELLSNFNDNLYLLSNAGCLESFLFFDKAQCANQSTKLLCYVL